MRGKNRSRSTISQLPPEVRDVVDEMVKATNTCTLADIQKYLASLDVTLSLQAISTYSRKLLASLEDIRVTNERMNAMVREAAKYPELDVPFPVSWTVKMKKKQKETQDILSYHSQAAGCSDKARAKASGGRQPIEECGRTGL